MSQQNFTIDTIDKIDSIDTIDINNPKNFPFRNYPTLFCSYPDHIFSHDDSDDEYDTVTESKYESRDDFTIAQSIFYDSDADTNDMDSKDSENNENNEYNENNE